ncbi:helix-turn-helix transcriptional regulator [Corynebacterium sp. YIM 101645]|uniref:Helix-turn-helix transcriptional regulator n=1 Tax=Corynebacterium lemuris TaxID=1859292 RepID=A0ABT2FZG7_9CORY|nr:helix-turn-helix domain-containing protein [Corynebacterium lemuris]MCS5479329.1 helix-turn-helix transcriptional regulator [Corynebacterium lemuris]
MNGHSPDWAGSYDPFDRTCPSRALLESVGDKWTILIVLALEEGPRRYGRIEETVDGISQKMLSQRLRRMTEDGLIARWAFEEVPPRVEYELTDLGRSLLPVAQALVDWVADHYATVAQQHRA